MNLSNIVDELSTKVNTQEERKIEQLSEQSKKVSELTKVNQENLTSTDQVIISREKSSEKDQNVTKTESILTENQLFVAREKEFAKKSEETHARDLESVKQTEENATQQNEYVYKTLQSYAYTSDNIRQTEQKVTELQRKRDEKIIERITNQLQEVNITRKNSQSNISSTGNMSEIQLNKSTLNVSSAGPVFSAPAITRPATLNVPEIEKAIRLAPMQAMYEFSGRQTQEIVQKLMVQIPKSENSQDTTHLRNTLETLVKKMNSLDTLNQHLEKGIKAKSQIVWSDLEDAQKSLDDLKSDTSVSFK